MLGGGLFARDFLTTGLRGLPEWTALDDDAVEAFATRAQSLLAPFLNAQDFEEAETEQKLVFPLLEALGWGHLPQQKTGKRRENVPDALLFASLLWWYSWRAAQHGKDEALRFFTAYVATLPVIKPPQDDQRYRALSGGIQATIRARQAAARALRAWYATEWGLTTIPNRLADPFALDAAGFVAALRAALPAKQRHLSAAAVARLHREHAETIAPIATCLTAAERDEQALSDLVNDAFGLTPEDVFLMWRAAPPPGLAT